MDIWIEKNWWMTQAREEKWVWKRSKWKMVPKDAFDHGTKIFSRKYYRIQSLIFDLISSDEERNIDFGSKLKEIVERWHHEASINYGLSNIKRLMLPLLVLESPALPQKTEQDLLKAYDTSERRRQLLFYLNYTQEDTCKRPLASSSSKWLPKNQTTCQVQEKCRKLCGKYNVRFQSIYRLFRNTIYCY